MSVRPGRGIPPVSLLEVSFLFFPVKGKKSFSLSNQGSKDKGCCIAARIVKPPEANLWFVILGFTNKMDLTSKTSLLFLVLYSKCQVLKHIYPCSSWNQIRNMRMDNTNTWRGKTLATKAMEWTAIYGHVQQANVNKVLRTSWSLGFWLAKSISTYINLKFWNFNHV